MSLTEVKIIKILISFLFMILVANVLTTLRVHSGPFRTFPVLSQSFHNTQSLIGLNPLRVHPLKGFLGNIVYVKNDRILHRFVHNKILM